MSDNMNTKDFMVGTLIGGLVGASLALLFAPKSGRELRRQLNDGAVGVAHRAGEWKDIAQEKGSKCKDRAVNQGSELKQKATDSTAQLTQADSEETGDLTPTVQTKVQPQQDKPQNEPSEPTTDDTAEVTAEKDKVASDKKIFKKN